MSLGEETVTCPKCGDMYPISEMHKHWNECTGKPKIPKSPINWVPPSSTSIPMSPTEPVKEKEIIIKEEVIKPSYCKKCGTLLVENDMFKVCPKDKIIKIKTKMWWWIILRYGMMIAWICILLGFILGITSYHAIYR